MKRRGVERRNGQEENHRKSGDTFVIAGKPLHMSS